MMTVRVVGVGEVLWDVLPRGRSLGGAPCNFACHAQGLGAESAVVSRLGEDSLGDESVTHLRGRGVDVRFLPRDPAHPTGTVSVDVDHEGKPTYLIHENVGWDFLEASAPSIAFLRGADCVCFGTLAQRSPVARESMRRLVEATPPDALRILDVNLRQAFYSAGVIEDSFRLANVVKLSDEELPVVSKTLGVAGSTTEQLAELAARFELRLIALTRGAAGSLLWSTEGAMDHPGVPAELSDTIGAGDSFTAALAMGLLAGHSLERINRQANHVAAWVCSQEGGTPRLPSEFAGWFTSAD